MGDPATPTIQDRAETLETARFIVAAVTKDEAWPLANLAAAYGSANGLVFALAQEVTLLAEQLAEVRAAKEELADLASRIDVGDGYVDHIAALRKVGA